MKVAKIKVDCLDCMGTDLTVVNAARVSFHKESDFDDFSAHGISAPDTKLITYLAKHNHWSPFAHCSASFRVKAPIFVARQLVKHTVGFSWNEVSRRYVDDEPEFYFPEVWRKKAENVKQGSSDEPVTFLRMRGFTEQSVESGVHHLTEHALLTYNEMLEAGVCPEQARMVLPQNTMTEWIWTGTLYAWARMCNLRLDSHTQKETREVAQYIDAELADLFPVSWKALKENK